MISGKHIVMRIGDMSPVLVPGVQQWSAEVDADELDGTTAEDEGYDNPDDGVKRCTVTAQLIMDIETGEYTPLSVGTQIADLKLYADANATTPIYHLGLAKVFRSSFRGEVKGRVTYDVTIRSKGEFVEADPS